MENRKSKFRFSAQDDIILLKEVVAERPFGSTTGWQIVAENTNLQIDGRRARERTALLLEYFRREDRASLRRYLELKLTNEVRF